MEEINFNKNIERIFNLIRRIDSKNNGNRARNLMKILSYEFNKISKEELINKFENKKDYYKNKNNLNKNKLEEIFYSLLYTKIKDINIIKDKGYAWGIQIKLNYERIENKKIKFSNIYGIGEIGNAKYCNFYDEIRVLDLSGFGSNFYNNSEAIGFESGSHSNFYNNSKASGTVSGDHSNFYDNSKASGFQSGFNSNFYNNSKAIGSKSGYDSNFNDYSEAIGFKSGNYSNFNDFSQATGLKAGRKSNYFANSRANGIGTGAYSNFHNNSKPIISHYI